VTGAAAATIEGRMPQAGAVGRANQRGLAVHESTGGAIRDRGLMVCWN
jgi:hypothetical protein